MLPPGSLPWATMASLPWHLEQVASMFAWLVRESASFARRMSWVPWQSVQLAATALPPLRASPCTVPAYSATAFSWHAAQLTGFSFSACGSFCADTSLWQSVHLSDIPPWTDALNLSASTAMDLPAAFFASLSA